MSRQSYHRGYDGIIIFVQLATSGQPRSQAGGNEADSDEGKDDGDDSKIDTTAIELIISCVHDSHLPIFFDVTRLEFCGVTRLMLG